MRKLEIILDANSFCLSFVLFFAPSKKSKRVIIALRNCFSVLTRLSIESTYSKKLAYYDWIIFEKSTTSFYEGSGEERQRMYVVTRVLRLAPTYFKI